MRYAAVAIAAFASMACSPQPSAPPPSVAPSTMVLATPLSTGTAVPPPTVTCEPGCGSSYRLAIYNLNRDPVQVLINGSDVGGLKCGDPPLMMTTSTVGPLPWKIEVIEDESGARLGPATYDGTWQEQALLIADIGLIPVPPVEPEVSTALPDGPDCPRIDPTLLPRGPLPT